LLHPQVCETVESQAGAFEHKAERMADSGNFDALMTACDGMGYGGSVVGDKPLHVTHFVPDSGEVTADQFVAWLLRAEGLDEALAQPKRHPHWNDLRRLFVKHMGAETVPARWLSWDA
jgi:hypothetical protein